MRPNAAITAVAGLLLLAPLAPALARASENVLTNPEFDNAQMEAGWTIALPGASGSLIDWTNEDANACPGSGSLRIASSTTDVGTQWAEVGQCLAINSSTWATGFHAAFSYFSYETLSFAWASYFYYSDTACGQAGGSYLGYEGDEGPIGPGWHRAAISRPTLLAHTQSVLVAVGAEAYQLTRMELSVDRAYFGPRPVVFTDDFEGVASTCRWSTTVP